LFHALPPGFAVAVGNSWSLRAGLVIRKLSGERTKRAAVTRALEEFVARRRQKDLLKLFGKLSWEHSFDYMAERSRE